MRFVIHDHLVLMSLNSSRRVLALAQDGCCFTLGTFITHYAFSL